MVERGASGRLEVDVLAELCTSIWSTGDAGRKAEWIRKGASADSARWRYARARLAAAVDLVDRGDSTCAGALARAAHQLAGANAGSAICEQATALWLLEPSDATGMMQGIAYYGAAWAPPERAVVQHALAVPVYAAPWALWGDAPDALRSDEVLCDDVWDAIWLSHRTPFLVAGACSAAIVRVSTEGSRSRFLVFVHRLPGAAHCMRDRIVTETRRWQRFLAGQALVPARVVPGLDQLAGAVAEEVAAELCDALAGEGPSGTSGQAMAASVWHVSDDRAYPVAGSLDEAAVCAHMEAFFDASTLLIPPDGSDALDARVPTQHVVSYALAALGRALANGDGGAEARAAIWREHVMTEEALAERFARQRGEAAGRAEPRGDGSSNPASAEIRNPVLEGLLEAFQYREPAPIMDLFFPLLAGCEEGGPARAVGLLRFNCFDPAEGARGFREALEGHARDLASRGFSAAQAVGAVVGFEAPPRAMGACGPTPPEWQQWCATVARRLLAFPGAPGAEDDGRAAATEAMPGHGVADDCRAQEHEGGSAALESPSGTPGEAFAACTAAALLASAGVSAARRFERVWREAREAWSALHREATLFAPERTGGAGGESPGGAIGAVRSRRNVPVREGDGQAALKPLSVAVVSLWIRGKDVWNAVPAPHEAGSEPAPELPTPLHGNLARWQVVRQWARDRVWHPKSSGGGAARALTWRLVAAGAAEGGPGEVVAEGTLRPVQDQRESSAPAVPLRLVCGVGSRVGTWRLGLWRPGSLRAALVLRTPRPDLAIDQDALSHAAAETMRTRGRVRLVWDRATGVDLSRELGGGARARHVDLAPRDRAAVRLAQTVCTRAWGGKGGQALASTEVRQAEWSIASQLARGVAVVDIDFNFVRALDGARARAGLPLADLSHSGLGWWFLVVWSYAAPRAPDVAAERLEAVIRPNLDAFIFARHREYAQLDLLSRWLHSVAHEAATAVEALRQVRPYRRVAAFFQEDAHSADLARVIEAPEMADAPWERWVERLASLEPEALEGARRREQEADLDGWLNLWGAALGGGAAVRGAAIGALQGLERRIRGLSGVVAYTRDQTWKKEIDEVHGGPQRSLVEVWWTAMGSALARYLGPWSREPDASPRLPFLRRWLGRSTGGREELGKLARDLVEAVAAGMSGEVGPLEACARKVHDRLIELGAWEAPRAEELDALAWSRLRLPAGGQCAQYWWSILDELATNLLKYIDPVHPEWSVEVAQLDPIGKRNRYRLAVVNRTEEVGTGSGFRPGESTRTGQGLIKWLVRAVGGDVRVTGPRPPGAPRYRVELIVPWERVESAPEHSAENEEGK